MKTIEEARKSIGRILNREFFVLAWIRISMIKCILKIERKGNDENRRN